MIVVVGGKAGAGKSTVAKALAKRLGLKHYSMGDLQRELAESKGISLAELGKLEEKDPSIDKELDLRQKKLGENENNFVIDGRLSVFFIPHADFKIFLDADERVRAERVLKSKRNEENGATVDEMAKKIRERELCEDKRFREYYDFDCYDKKNYDAVIDTTRLPVDEIIASIRNLIKKEAKSQRQ